MLASMLPKAKGKGLPGMEMDISSPAENGGKPSSGTIKPCRKRSAPPSTYSASWLLSESVLQVLLDDSSSLNKLSYRFHEGGKLMVSTLQILHPESTGKHEE